jgi:hypothetical protein
MLCKWCSISLKIGNPSQKQEVPTGSVMLLIYVYVCGVFIFQPILNIFSLCSLYYSLHREWRDIFMGLTDFLSWRENVNFQ